jgi:hypothetical protein
MNAGARRGSRTRGITAEKASAARLSKTSRHRRNLIIERDDDAHTATRHEVHHRSRVSDSPLVAARAENTGYSSMAQWVLGHPLKRFGMIELIPIRRSMDCARATDWRGLRHVAASCAIG